MNFLSQKEQKLTYRETVNETNKLGKTFYNELGVKYGTKYSLFINNRIEYVTNWFGGLRKCFEKKHLFNPHAVEI